MLTTSPSFLGNNRKCFYFGRRRLIVRLVLNLLEAHMNRTKLLSSDPLSLDNLFPLNEFKEVLSPIVAPETDADAALVDECSKVLDCYSSRAVSLSKLRVLLSSFLLQSQRLEDRLQRKGGELIIGWPHAEAYFVNHQDQKQMHC